MIEIFRRLAFPIIFLIVLAGCADHSVRHLSSDISMIKVGRSKRIDVQTYLGEPDEKRVVSDKREEWVYLEEKRSALQNIYVVGGLFSGKGFSSIVLTFEGDVVVASEYRTGDTKETAVAR